MKSSLAWATWSLATLFYAYQYILRVAPNVLIGDIKTTYQMDDSLFGQFSGIYYIGYALIHLPLGLLLDRYGPKRIMPLFLGFTIIGMAPLAFSNYWPFAVLGRLLVGIGSTAAILGLFKIIRMGFAKEMFPWMLSVSVPVGLLGAIYGGLPLSKLHESMGLQKIALLLIGIGFILAVLLYFVIPDLENEKSHTSVWGEARVVLSNRYVLITCLLAGLMVGPLEGFADVWGTTFLRSVYGLEKDTAAALPSWIFFGMCFGGAFLSLIARLLKDDIWVIFLCGFGMMLAFVGLIYGVFPPSVLAAVFFFVGLLSAYQIIAISHVSTTVPSQFSGLASSVANMVIMTFGYIFHSLIGGTVHFFTGNEPVKEALLPAKTMAFGIAVIPVGLAIATAGFLVIAMRTKKNLS